MNTIPQCSCGAHDWKQGGGSFSLIMQEKYYKCNVCHKTGLQFSRYGYYTFLIFNQSSAKAVTKYINGCLLDTANEYKIEVDKIKEGREDADIASLFDSLGLDFANGWQYEAAKDEDGVPIKVPSKYWKDGEYTYEYQDSNGKRLDTDQVSLRQEMKKIFDKHNVFSGKVVVPQMPDHFPFYMDGYLLVNGEWVKIKNSLNNGGS